MFKILPHFSENINYIFFLFIAHFFQIRYNLS